MTLQSHPERRRGALPRPRSFRGRPALSGAILLALACTLACLAPPAAAAALPCDGSAPAWITVEIDGARFARDEPVEYIEIDRGGCVTTRYGSFDVRAGVYRRLLGDGERSELAATVARTRIEQFDARALKAKLVAQDKQLRAKAAPGEVVGYAIADGDIVRIAVDTGERRNVIEWQAPAQESALRPDNAELKQLVEFLGAVQAQGADARKRRIDGGTP